MSQTVSHRSRREFLKLSAIVGAGAALAACTPAATTPGTTGGTGETTTTGATTVKWWMSGAADEMAWLGPEVEHFNSSRTDVQIDLIAVPDQYSEKVTTSIAAGDGPDVWFTIMTVNAARFGHMEQLDDYITGDNFDRSVWFNSAWQNYLYQGNQYAVPWDIGWANYAAHHGLFAQFGQTVPEVGPDWTPDTFMALAAAMTDEAQGTFGGHLAGGGALLWGGGALPYNMGFNVVGNDGTQVVGFLDSPASIAAIQFVLDMQSNGYSPSGEQAQALGGEVFQSGKVAIGGGGSWGVQTLLDLPFEWSQLEPPTPQGGTRHSWTDSVQFHMWSGSPRKDAAWEVLKYISGPEGTRFAHDAGQRASPCPSVWEETGRMNDPVWSWWLEQAQLPTQIQEYQRTTYFWDCIGSPYMDIWTRYLELGERPLEAIVQNAAAVAQECLDEAYAAEAD